MKVAIFALAVLVALVHVAGADRVKCYQCPISTETCYAKDAGEVTCPERSVCSRNVKKTGEDKLKAIRKCVIPGPENPNACTPKDSQMYDCTVCSTDLCNSSDSLKISRVSIIASFVLASLFFLNH